MSFGRFAEMRLVPTPVNDMPSGVGQSLDQVGEGAWVECYISISPNHLNRKVQFAQPGGEIWKRERGVSDVRSGALAVARALAANLSGAVTSIERLKHSDQLDQP